MEREELLMRFLFKEIVIEYHGGPVDGRTIKVPPSWIEERLVEIEDGLFIIEDAITSRSNIDHFYYSNGPLDNPILENHIALDHCDARKGYVP